ncbi:hypothetical protein BDV36DRAFT_144600 [Aspergillus pseudocaelatus]|uniref:Uncharacterized protein n=1 Tax=Aspergillus pseudocaelatus TaxID=1825620 RepID=A0ABQ6WPS8_9EURO|nr:hypothetical protein BDV36DRAFT_144600 [Aspergillus pseudocaelatus]
MFCISGFCRTSLSVCLYSFSFPFFAFLSCHVPCFFPQVFIVSIILVHAFRSVDLDCRFGFRMKISPPRCLYHSWITSFCFGSPFVSLLFSSLVRVSCAVPSLLTPLKGRDETKKGPPTCDHQTRVIECRHRQGEKSSADILRKTCVYIPRNSLDGLSDIAFQPYLASMYYLRDRARQP